MANQEVCHWNDFSYTPCARNIPSNQVDDCQLQLKIVSNIVIMGTLVTGLSIHVTWKLISRHMSDFLVLCQFMVASWLCHTEMFR